MRTLIVHCKVGHGDTPSIIRASRVMRKLEMKGSAARFAVACTAPHEYSVCDEQEVFVVCDDFKGSDYDVQALHREFSATIWMDVFNHCLKFEQGKWMDTGMFWTTDFSNKKILGWYQPLNQQRKYLVDTPF